MAKIGINRGDVVADIACGPGYYCDYLADLVGETGTVLGFDRDPAHIAWAHNNLIEKKGRKNVHFYEVDIEKSNIELDGPELLDVAIFFNCISYFSDPEKVIRKIKNISKKEVTIIIKEAETALSLLEPIPDGKWQNILSLLHTHRPEKPREFMLSEVISIVKNLGAKNINIDMWPVVFFPPISDSERAHIEQHCSYIIGSMAPYLKKDQEFWNNVLEKMKDGSFFDKDDFMFTAIDTVVTCNIN